MCLCALKDPHTVEETIVPAMREWLLGNKQSFDMHEQIA